jgi:catabolite regulation protein CreA
VHAYKQPNIRAVTCHQEKARKDNINKIVMVTNKSTPLGVAPQFGKLRFYAT